MTDSHDDQTSSSVPPSNNQPGPSAPNPYSQSGGEPKKTLSLAAAGVASVPDSDFGLALLTTV